MNALGLLRRFFSFVCLIVLIFFPLIGLAQQGIIRGRVFNERTNEPLPFTNLVIYNTNTGTVTDIDGNFVFQGVKPGFVRLQVSAVGFESRTTQEIMVTNARAATIDIGLRAIDVQLDAVEVRASLFERSDDSPVSLRRISLREIERSPGSNRDISKVIQSLPGVAFTPSFRNDVIVRGGGPNENRFFLDGIEIPNINHFSTQGASGGPVGIINVDFIREVEMYTGAFAASRGNALSSVLEMRQINGNTEGMNLRATLGASDLALTVDGPLSSNTTMIVSARRSYLQFIFGIIGLPFLPTYNGFQFKTNTKFSDRGELSFIGIGALDNFELNLNANETEEQRFILDYLPVSEQWNYAVGSVYRHYRSNGFDTWVLSRNMLRNFTYKHPDNDESVERSLDYVSDEIENKARFERSITAGEYRLSFGAGAEYARFNASRTAREFFMNQVISFDTQSQLDFFKWAFFGQGSRSLFSDRLTLSLGIRADANSYSPQMSKLYEQISPRLSASWRLKDGFFLNFNAGRYYQLPPYTTLGYVDTEGILVNRKNGLKYISADHLVAGIEVLQGQSGRITLEGFYKNYGQYPFSVRDSVSIGSRPADFGVFGAEEVISTGKGRAVGGELLFQQQDFYNFNVILAYTFVRSEFKDNRNNYVPSAWDNRNIVILTLLRILPRNWEAGIKWRYSGGAPYTPYDLELSSIKQAWDVQGRAYLDYSRFNQERLPSFHQLDLRIDKQFFLRNLSLMLYLDIQNIYNFKSRLPDDIILKTDQNGQAVTYVEDGVERYELKRIENAIGTVLPSVGIILEF